MLGNENSPNVEITFETQMEIWGSFIYLRVLRVFILRNTAARIN